MLWSKMGTPTFYRGMSHKFALLKWRYMLLIFGGILVSLSSMAIMHFFKINLLPLFGLAVIFETWGWGLFLMVVWFERKSKSNSKIITIFRVFSDWQTAIFLDIWFIVGTVAPLLFFTSFFKD
jgi:ABC-type uncharacterized transport system permease subunit